MAIHKLWLSCMLCLCLTSLVSRVGGGYFSTQPSFTSFQTAASMPRSTSNRAVGRQIWCIGKPAAQDANLMRNVEYACGQAGVDCSAIQPGGACYRPNSVISHASYAMNLYYQKNGRNWWTCDFINTGILVFTDPSFGDCIYPSQ
eukprot:c18899_g2_i1 orf=125-559(+)